MGCTSNPTILMPSLSKKRSGRLTRGHPPCSKHELGFRLRSALSPILLFCVSIVASAQAPSQPHPFATRRADQPKRENTTPQQIPLTVPAGTPIRVALSGRVRIARQGAPLIGKVTDTVYAFDQPVIPAGSEVRGRVTQVAPVPKMRRIMAIANADFSPPHEYEVTFDKLILNDGKNGGRVFPLQTKVALGTQEVIHLSSSAPPQKKNAAGDWSKRQKQAIRDRVHKAKVQVNAPGRIDRAKQFLLAQLPYRRQFLAADTRFTADLTAPLDFGVTTRTAEQLSSLGNEITPDSTLHARFVDEVSSATARNGASIEAVVTEPLFDARNHLVIAVNSRLVGIVTHAQPARKLHHNGELRVAFEQVTTPEGMPQAVQGNLSGVTLDRSANVKIDEEGGTRVTDNKSRYLMTGLSLTIAAFAARGDPDAPSGSGGINPGQSTVAGVSGFKLVGAVVTLGTHSRVFSSVLGGYGAARSVYTHFLSRGRDVVLPKDTAVEVAIGDRRSVRSPH